MIYFPDSGSLQPGAFAASTRMSWQDLGYFAWGSAVGPFQYALVFSGSSGSSVLVVGLALGRTVGMGYFGSLSSDLINHRPTISDSLSEPFLICVNSCSDRSTAGYCSCNSGNLLWFRPFTSSVAAFTRPLPSLSCSWSPFSSIWACSASRGTTSPFAFNLLYQTAKEEKAK